MASRCRGIVVASNTNRARTQMAEAFLRHLTNSKVFVTSGGVRRASSVLPAAVQVLREVGVEMAGQSPSSIAAVLNQAATFDVYISIDAPLTQRHAIEHDHSSGEPEYGPHGEEIGDAIEASPAYGSELLALGMPAHWTPLSDAADAREKWTLWTPRNPMIMHERSRRKLQDHLYEGEPLFQTVEEDKSATRHKIRWQEQWILPSVAHKYAMERDEDFLRRVRSARDAIFEKCVEFLGKWDAQDDVALLQPSVASRLRSSIASHR